MSKAFFIAACAGLLLAGCKQRQHISRANIEVVQHALENAVATDGHFAYLTRNPTKKKEESIARPSPARTAASETVVTAKEVESVLGPPHEIYPPETALRDVEVFRYYYYQDADLYMFNFHDGRLIEIKLEPPGTTPKKS